MKAPFPPRMQFVTDILRMQEVAKEEGLAEGMGRGRAEGEALALLTVLRSRNLPLSPELRDRIIGCTDTGQLTHWLERSLTITAADQLFED